MTYSDSSLRSKLILQIEKLSEDRHRFYLLFTAALATLGFAYLLILPVIFIASLYILVELIQGVESAQDWVWIGVVSSVAAICAYASFYSLKMKISHVCGFKLSENMAPGIHNVVKEVQSHYKRPSISRIVITDKYEIRIECLPASGISVLHSNTLVIGLPLLQTLTPEEFRCELSRCIGQHSGIIPRVTLFIYKARTLWRAYSHSLRKSAKPGERLLKWFFVPYSQLFDMVAIPAIRQEELSADLCALDFINDKVVLDTLKSESISRAFLELHYWSSVRSMVLKDHMAQIRPFSKLEKVLQSVSSLESRKKWLGFAYDSEQLPGDTMPGLKERMESIGHVKIQSIPVPAASAAEKYLGKNKNKVVSIIDKLWHSTTLNRWVKEYKAQTRDLKKVQSLSRKSRQQVLLPGDTLRYALLARKLNGSPLAASIRKIMKRNIQNLLPSFLANKARSPAEPGNIFR